MMMIPEKLERFLKKNHVFYEVLVHPERFTSPETAEAGHVSGKQFAKVVMLKIRGREVMAVLPASGTVDLLKFSTLAGTQDVQVETESDFGKLFPDCEPGAMPPIGKIYDVPCYIDKSLQQVDEICFNAGTHRVAVKVFTVDFFRVVKGIVGDFAVAGQKIAA